MIVKLQLDAAGESLLIYDKNRKMVPVEVQGPAAAKLAAEYELQPLTKCYAEAVLVGEQLILGMKVKDQDW